MSNKWRIRSVFLTCTLGMFLGCLAAGLSGAALLTWVTAMTGILLACDLWLEHLISCSHR
jgi:hypothetical protein